MSIFAVNFPPVSNQATEILYKTPGGPFTKDKVKNGNLIEALKFDQLEDILLLLKTNSSNCICWIGDYPIDGSQVKEIIDQKIVLNNRECFTFTEDDIIVFERTSKTYF